MLSDILEIKFGVAGLQLAKQAKRIKSLDTLQQIRIGLKQAATLAEAEALFQTSLLKKSGNEQQEKMKFQPIERIV